MDWDETTEDSESPAPVIWVMELPEEDETSGSNDTMSTMDHGSMDHGSMDHSG